MASYLIFRQCIDLPFHPKGDFDHGDVFLPNGFLFIANTAAGTVEVVDGERLRHLLTIPNCPEASGVVVAQQEGLVFAAARGVGKLLVIDAISPTVVRTVAVGTGLNGLAWDAQRHHLLVADVADQAARLVDPQAGRPRWTVYEPTADRFLVAIREPVCLAVLSADPFTQIAQFPIGSPGPHGMDLDEEGCQAFVACDGKMVVSLDRADGRERGRGAIFGAPDAVFHNHRLHRLSVALAHLGTLDAELGAINVVNTHTMKVEEQITTEAGAHTLAYDSLRQRLYVFLSSCRVAVYEESAAGSLPRSW